MVSLEAIAGGTVVYAEGVWVLKYKPKSPVGGSRNCIVITQNRIQFTSDYICFSKIQNCSYESATWTS